MRGGINLYAYVGGNPVNWLDPEGLEVHDDYLSDEEKALLDKWMKQLEKCAKCDEELRKRLAYVKSKLYHYYVKFRPGTQAGGFNEPNEVRLDPTLKDPYYKGETYHAKKRKSDKRKIGYYRGPDVLAHELLGHGYDVAHKKGKDEGTARGLGNKIRACLENYQPQRVTSLLDYIFSSD